MTNKIKDINLFNESALDERVRQLENIVNHIPIDTRSIAKDGLQSTNFRSGEKGYTILPNGNAEFQNINIGHKIITISPGQSISDAITLLDADG